ncbi:hypothetical protein GN156_00140 [bacterium LRH843]|nr:hypothetical protein [bacterium LRH843]
MIKGIDTPALVVDLDKMDHHLNRMMTIAKKKKVKLRPHTKTHKSPEIALLQLERGATGITVATLGEAEVMRKHGITNILIAYPIIGETKLTRLKALAKNTDVTISLDSFDVAEGINTVGEELGKKMPIYLEIDTGYGRCGLPIEEDLFKLADQLKQLAHIEIVGVMTHPGHSYKVNTTVKLHEISRNEAEKLVEAKLTLNEQFGFNIREVSIGSTPTSLDETLYEGVTEMRPGTYIFNDATLTSLGLIEENDCALTVYATVVSTPSPNHFIVDAGSKTLTSDKGAFTKGYGFIKGSDDVWVSWLSEEHGVVELQGNKDYKIGDQLEIIPNHVCPAVNLADELIGIRNGEIERIISIDARGKNK